jgi:hypothetical protein
MTENLNTDFAITVFLVALLFVLVRDLIIDLIFYARNNWDWNKDSGRTLLEGALPTFGKRTSNRQRVLVGLPFFILVVFFLLTLFSFR